MSEPVVSFIRQTTSPTVWQVPLEEFGILSVKKTKIFALLEELGRASPTYSPQPFTWAQVTNKDISSPPDEFFFEGKGCSHSCSLTSPHASSRYMSDSGGWILLKHTHLFYSKVGLSTLCLYKWVPQKWSFHRYQVISGFETSYTLPHLKLILAPLAGLLGGLSQIWSRDCILMMAVLCLLLYLSFTQSFKQCLAHHRVQCTRVHPHIRTFIYAQWWNEPAKSVIKC